MDPSRVLESNTVGLVYGANWPNRALHCSEISRLPPNMPFDGLTLKASHHEPEGRPTPTNKNYLKLGGQTENGDFLNVF